MNKDDVIRWAREAGLDSYGPTSTYPAGYGEFIARAEHFAALAYAAGVHGEIRRVLGNIPDGTGHPNGLSHFLTGGRK